MLGTSNEHRRPCREVDRHMHEVTDNKQLLWRKKVNDTNHKAYNRF